MNKLVGLQQLVHLRMRTMGEGRRFPSWMNRWATEEVGEFGLSSLIGVAIGLIIAAFVLIPGVRDFAGRIIADMDSWWKSSVSSQVFPK